MRMASSPSPSVVPPNGSGEDYAGLWGMVTLSESRSSAINFLVRLVASAVSLWFVSGYEKTLVWGWLPTTYSHYASMSQLFHCLRFWRKLTMRSYIRAGVEFCRRLQHARCKKTHSWLLDSISLLELWVSDSGFYRIDFSHSGFYKLFDKMQQSVADVLKNKINQNLGGCPGGLVS